MGLFDAKFCKHCGAKIGLGGKTKLTDGNYVCSKCTKVLPLYIETSRYNYEQLSELLNYIQYSKNELSKVFRKNHSFHDLDIDTEHGLFYIQQYNSFYFKFSDIVDWDISYVPTTQKESLLGSKVWGDIVFKFRMEHPYVFAEHKIAVEQKVKATIVLGQITNLDSPKGMDEFLHYFDDAYTSALVAKGENEEV